MFQTEDKYLKVLKRLQQSNEFIAKRHTNLQQLGLDGKQIAKAIQSTLCFHDQLKEEVEAYEAALEFDRDLLKKAEISVDFQHLETRAKLTKMVCKLFSLWQLSTDDQLILLGYSPKSVHTMRRYQNGQSFPYRKNLIERVGHLLSLHASIRTLFPHNRDLVYAWINSANSNPLFYDRTPLSIMKQSMDGIRDVCRHVNYLLQI